MVVPSHFVTVVFGYFNPKKLSHIDFLKTPSFTSNFLDEGHRLVYMMVV